jgi:putative two-component system response regulator
LIDTGEGVMKKRILIVEDETIIARDIQGKLESLGYEAAAIVSSGEEAIAKAGELRPDLVLMDIVIKGDIDGIEAARQIKDNYNIPVVYITAYADEKTLGRAMITDPFGYLIKPFEERELHSTIEMALHKHESTEEILKSMEGTINALASALEMRDPYTAGHQRHVAELTVAIARDMSVPDYDIKGLRLASLIHDIGKIQVPSEILSKPGKLTEFEYGLIKTHSQAGYDIMKNIEFPWPIADIVHQHHERLDGSGYPQGLKGDDILPQAKIMAVADVVEAMSSHRPYRPALGIDEALEEIASKKGILYDDDVANSCIRLFKENKFKFEDR